MHGPHPLRHPDRHPHVPPGSGHLLLHHVPRRLAHRDHGGSSVSPAPHLVSDYHTLNIHQNYKKRIPFRIEAVQMIFVIIGAGMAALGFMILFVGFLATGATRYKVYRAWRSRVGGRISCAVLMGITYLLNFVWSLILCFLVVVTFIYTMFWNMCSSVEHSQSCIDLTQFRKDVF